MQIELDCVILCGGKSSRMGENKAFLDFDSKPLIKYLIDKYRPIFRSIYLCHKPNQDFHHLPCLHILEDCPTFAPLFGLQASLEFLQKPTFFLCVDYPLLQTSHLAHIAQTYLNQPLPITYATTEQKSHFLIGIYEPSTLTQIKQQIKSYNFKMSHLIQSCRTQEVFFNQQECFCNLNTPEDYQNALQTLKDNNGR